MHDFLVTKRVPLPELKSTLTELKHHSGALVIHIANEDVENFFCLSFQTLPTSSNGAPHILEHIVLCGSKKFPVKDPFFAMARRSLHTFMNAFTGQDFTCYPASSQVEKDFYNLLEVYLDAVFFPELKNVSFLQEGRRLAWSAEGKLEWQGIVYNEMKGAMSSSESRLAQAISKHLFPHLPYAYNSGGDPKEIPKLTYEELLAFHRAFYHPSRCLFFFYGHLPLTQHLDFLHAHVLKNVVPVEPLKPLPREMRLEHPIRAVDVYPLDAKEGLRDKAEIAFVWLTAHITEQSDVLALSLLESILLETDASLLKKALLKSKLCKDVTSSLDVEMSEIPFCVVCHGCAPKHEDALRELTLATLRTLLHKPIETDVIEAALHQLEFERTEIGSDGEPFGLHLFMRAGLLKQHGGSPEQALLIHSLFDVLRASLQEPDYLPGLILKYFLDNPHFLTQVLLPDPDLEKREQEEEEARLRGIAERLNEREKQEIQRSMEELEQYQESLEGQSHDCLPKIGLGDIPPEPKDFPLEKRDDIYIHDCFTNHIVYADLLFDLPPIEAEDLPLLSLMTHMWTELGCKGQSYEETLPFMQAHTGGMGARLGLHVSSLDPNVLKPSFSLRGKALSRKAKYLFQLLEDFATSPNFSEVDRIREWLMQHVTALEQDLTANALNYAIQKALAGNSIASFIYDQWHGLAYYQWVQQLAKGHQGNWMKRLAELASRITWSKPKLILSASAEDIEYIDLWEPRAAVPWSEQYQVPRVESHIRILASPVAFTAWGFQSVTYLDPHAAALMVSTHLLDHVVLHKEVREKGGAYGSGATYDPTTGNFHFYSYRDPNLGRTLGVFRMAIERIGEGQFSEQDLEEAKISLIASMDTPIAPGKRAIVAYAWLRASRTYEARKQFRQEILALTREGVIEAVLQHVKPHAGTVVSFMGEELAKREGGVGLPMVGRA